MRFRCSRSEPASLSTYAVIPLGIQLPPPQVETQSACAAMASSVPCATPRADALYNITINPKPLPISFTIFNRPAMGFFRANEVGDQPFESFIQSSLARPVLLPSRILFWGPGSPHQALRSLLEGESPIFLSELASLFHQDGGLRGWSTLSNGGSDNARIVRSQLPAMDTCMPVFEGASAATNPSPLKHLILVGSTEVDGIVRRHRVACVLGCAVSFQTLPLETSTAGCKSYSLPLAHAKKTQRVAVSCGALTNFSPQGSDKSPCTRSGASLSEFIFNFLVLSPVVMIQTRGKMIQLTERCGVSTRTLGCRMPNVLPFKSSSNIKGLNHGILFRKARRREARSLSALAVRVSMSARRSMRTLSAPRAAVRASRCFYFTRSGASLSLISCRPHPVAPDGLSLSSFPVPLGFLGSPVGHSYPLPLLYVPSVGDVRMLCDDSRGLEWYHEGVRRALHVHRDAGMLAGAIMRVGAYRSSSEVRVFLSTSREMLTAFCEGLVDVISSVDAPCGPRLNFVSLRSICSFLRSLHPLLPEGVVRLSSMLRSNDPVLQSVRQWLGDGFQVDDVGSGVHVSGCLSSPVTVVLGSAARLTGARCLELSDPLFLKGGSSRVLYSEPLMCPERLDTMVALARAREEARLLLTADESRCVADRAVRVAKSEVTALSEALYRRICKGVGFGGPHPPSTNNPLIQWLLRLQSTVLGQRGEASMDALDALVDGQIVLEIISCCGATGALRDLVDALLLQITSLLYLMQLSGDGMLLDGTELIRDAREYLLSQREAGLAMVQEVLATRPWQYLAHNLLRSHVTGAKLTALRQVVEGWWDRHRCAPSVLVFVNTQRHPLPSYHSVLRHLLKMAGGDDSSYPASTLASLPIATIAGHPVDYVVSGRIRVAVACTSCVLAHSRSEAQPRRFIADLLASFGNVVACWEARVGGCRDTCTAPSIPFLEALEREVSEHPSRPILAMLPQL